MSSQDDRNFYFMLTIGHQSFGYTYHTIGTIIRDIAKAQVMSLKVKNFDLRMGKACVPEMITAEEGAL